MITRENHKKLLDSGLNLDHYLVLSNIHNNLECANSKRISGFINLLTKKGYISEGSLTEKGLSLIRDFDKDLTFTTSTTTTTTVTPIGGNKLFLVNNLATWVNSVHLKCQDKLMELTGKKQIRAGIDRKFYSFLPNSIDLGRVLAKVITTYKLNDLDKIEKTLLKYIEKCNSSNNWFPLMQYFIFKNGTSALVTMMEEDEDDVSTGKDSQQKFV